MNTRARKAAGSALSKDFQVERHPDFIELSVVMPCLNEAETLGECIRKAQQAIADAQLSAEIVIGDNGSTDGSQAIAEALGARVIPVPVRGYGAAVYHACHAAQGKYILMADADDSYDFLSILPYVEKLRSGAELVMGNRFTGGIRPGAMPWKNRYIGNPILSTIGRVLFSCPAKDFHCGMRAFTKEAFFKMDLRTTGMEFASEMVIKATLAKLQIAEVPTTLSPDGRSRPPHLRPWRDGYRHLRFMLLYSPRWLFLYPGILLSALGIALVGWLFPGTRELGALRLDVHTMLFGAASVLIGVQAISFALSARIVATAFGLLPKQEGLSRISKWLRPEHGIFGGAVLALLGTAGAVVALSEWAETSFGNLQGHDTLRLVILSVLLLTLGGQIILNSLFFGLLALDTRELESNP